MDELDGRIRSAVFELLDAAPDAPPFPELDTSIGGRPRHPRSGRVVIAGIAVVAAVALTVGVVVGVAGDSGTSRVSAPTHSAPTTLVAMANTTLVVMANDGTVLRTLATGLDPTSTLATTPDGGQVYLDTFTATAECSPQGPSGVESIVRYPVDGSGGPGPVAGIGTDPAISPNGRYLAYARLRQPCLTGTRERIQAEDVVIHDLATGAERVWTTHEPVTGEGDFHYYSSNISWAPDSRHLAFEWDTPEGKPVHVVDAGRSGDIDTTPTIRVPDGVSWVGYLGATGKALGVAGTDGPYGSPPGPSPSVATPLSVVAFDPGTGTVDATLFTTAGFTVNTRTAVARNVTVDRSGNDILLGATLGTGTLLSWSAGDSRPHAVGPALSGAWIEPPRASTVTWFPCSEAAFGTNDVSGRTVVFDRLAFPGATGSGLLVRPGTAFELTVPRAWRDRLRVGWGGPAQYGTHIEAVGCTGFPPYRWIGFDGGFRFTGPACIPLVVKVGTDQRTVHLGVCPRGR